VKSQADVHALMLKLKKLKGESHDVEGRREQREAPVHRLKDVIDEQRQNDIADCRDKGCGIALSNNLAAKQEPDSSYSGNASVKRRVVYWNPPMGKGCGY
jgi:hypothetical protein